MSAWPKEGNLREDSLDLSGIIGELFGEPFIADDNFCCPHEDRREDRDEEEDEEDDTVPKDETEELLDGD